MLQRRVQLLKMTKINEVYKCEICGNIVEMLHEGAGELFCCGQPMELMEEKTQEEGNEKHKPVIENNTVKVGSVPHPMEDKHYIEWIEIITKDGVIRKHLKPGEKPEKEFEIKGETIARAYCNIHGLWRH